MRALPLPVVLLAMEAPEIVRPEAAISRLTAKERECLRLWLEYKTAKEIALDLGISHHAVEKRLKMARTKLGVATSLEAARVLAQAEGYDRAVAGPPDLPPSSASRKSWQLPTIILGAVAMLLALVLAATLPPASPSSEAIEIADGTREIELDGNLETVFDELDKDASGFLEMTESPFVTLTFQDRAPGERLAETLTGTVVLGAADDSEQLAAFYNEADTDGDRRISFREYHSWSSARLAELGIERTSVLKIQQPSEN
ncbi:LuxR C-terminal-related transcriptional regulator [Qipengyuania flava]|nr:LuxR C-terminal-related transcriptional regulator [Qipengyuania flava]